MFYLALKEDSTPWRKACLQGLKEHMESKKDSKDEDKDDKEKAYMKGEDKKEEDKEDKKKSEEFSDVITSDYLNWMEDTLKSGGVDIDAPQGPTSMTSEKQT